MSRTFFLLSFLVFIAGCSKPPVYENHVKMDNQVWNRFDFLFFEVPVQDDQLYDFYLDADFTTDYPWDYLELNITFYESGGGMRSADYVFNIDKSKTNKEGIIKGAFTVIKGMRFSSTGISKVRVENKMYKVQTPGVASVGFIARMTESE